MEREVSSSLRAKQGTVASVTSFHLPHRSPPPCYPRSLWSLHSSLGLCWCLIPAEPVMVGKKCSPWALRETKVPTWPFSMDPHFLSSSAQIRLNVPTSLLPHSMVPETCQSCWFWTHPELWGTPWVFHSEWSSWRGSLLSPHLLTCLFRPVARILVKWRKLWAILQDIGKIMGG